MGTDPTHPSRALGIIGLDSLTAYCGLLEIGAPKAGETVVTVAAISPVGATVGQIAKIKWRRAVGVARGAEKCAYAVNELGFDACIDRNAPDFEAQLAAACPDGIDVYFENVGGAMLAAVFPLLNPFARVPLCGLASQYNATSMPEGPDRSGAMLGAFLTKKIKVEGFIVWDSFPKKYSLFAK
jgi:NADPH-dependent curcumin reductase CurA